MYSHWELYNILRLRITVQEFLTEENSVFTIWNLIRTLRLTRMFFEFCFIFKRSYFRGVHLSFMSYQLSQHKKYFFSHQKQKSLKNFYHEIEISNFFLFSQKAEILPQYPFFFVYLRFQQTCLWRFSALKEKNKIVYFSFVLNVIVKQFKGIVMQII